MKKEMIRVSTFGKLNVEKLKVPRIERGVVVYMDEKGSTYKEDKKSQNHFWCEEGYQAQKFINDTYYKEEKKARDKQLELTRKLKDIGND